MLTKTQNMNHEIVMPKKYVDLSKEEMEYDGGIEPVTTTLAIIAISVAVAAWLFPDEGRAIGNTIKVVNTVAVPVAINVAVQETVKVAVQAFDFLKEMPKRIVM